MLICENSLASDMTFDYLVGTDAVEAIEVHPGRDDGEDDFEVGGEEEMRAGRKRALTRRGRAPGAPRSWRLRPQPRPGLIPLALGHACGLDVSRASWFGPR